MSHSSLVKFLVSVQYFFKDFEGFFGRIAILRNLKLSSVHQLIGNHKNFFFSYFKYLRHVNLDYSF